jgi:hypothetical protein
LDAAEFQDRGIDIFIFRLGSGGAIFRGRFGGGARRQQPGIDGLGNKLGVALDAQGLGGEIVEVAALDAGGDAAPLPSLGLNLGAAAKSIGAEAGTFSTAGQGVTLRKAYRLAVAAGMLEREYGIAADALLSAAGVFQFPGGVLVPLWLCCLWLAFAAALRRSLGWLGVRPWLAAVAGAIAFPLNYWVGQRAGAVEFGYSLPATLALLAVTWAILLPLMYRIGESRAVVQGRGIS